MGNPDFQGRTAEQIVNEPLGSTSEWHVHVALSWIDYVKRSSAATALHYAALHLRLGIEYLWFQIFWARSGRIAVTCGISEGNRYRDETL
jgi:hypothetical protein